MRDRVSFTTAAPGRICLFGEHQDYLGLRVIAQAINLKFYVHAYPSSMPGFHIIMPDIKEEESFFPEGDLLYAHSRDYIKAGVNVVKRELGIREFPDYDFIFHSTIPINAGCSSSSAMAVAWVKTLLFAVGREEWKDRERVAYLAYLSEVREFSESGGMMDHYTSSFGNLLLIDASTHPFGVEKLSYGIKGFVLGNSREKKDTLGTLKSIRDTVESAISKIKRLFPEFDLSSTPIEKVEPYFKELEDREAELLLANLINRDILWEALAIIKHGIEEPSSEPTLSQRKLGKLLTRHHEQLRDALGISTPKIENMLQAAMEAGALGGKINGSGGGGTMIAYAPGREKEVAQAIKEAGGDAWILYPAPGASIYVEASSEE